MSQQKICPTCGFLGKEKSLTKGSVFIELFLWGAFLAPGLLYSLWRLSSKEKVCPGCAGKMISVTSPMGIELCALHHKPKPVRLAGVSRIK